MRSLRLRLALAGIVGIGIALTLAGFALVGIFDAHIRQRYIKELDDHLLQLLAMIEIDTSGTARLTQELSEPGFRRPLSGQYWQATRDSAVVLKSRSLWDEVLSLPDAPLRPGRLRSSEIVGPLQTRLVLVERLIETTGEPPVPLRLSVAGDSSVIDTARRDFAGTVGISLLILGSLLTAATWLQVGAGLAPLQSIRQRLESIRAGSAAKLEGDFPVEVAGLVEALNGLIETEKSEVERARSNAAALGHGLKTPLAVLAAEARELRDAGQATRASAIEHELDTMNAHVTRAIALARAVGPRTAIGTRTDITAALARLTAVMKRLPRGAELSWEIVAPATPIVARIDARDIDDVLGNLLDNARKWARTRVRIASAREAGGCVITVEDDGPGIPPQSRDHAMKRGVRLDLDVPGTGVGLGIVDDLARLHSGSLVLRHSDLGGLAAKVRLSAIEDAAERPGG